MVTFLGSLVQLCSGEGGILQTNITGMCGECLQCLGCTGFAPAHSVCAFMVYTSQALGCSAGNCLRQTLGCVHFPGLSHSGSGCQVLHKGADSVGPAFCALPRSEQLRRPGAWRVHTPHVWCILSPPHSQPVGFLGARWAIVSVALCVSSGELISGCNPRSGCHLSRIPGSLG